jgi:hypothetical protein
MRKTSAMTMARRTPSPSTSPLSAISGVVSVSPSRSSSARRCASSRGCVASRFVSSASSAAPAPRRSAESWSRAHEPRQATPGLARLVNGEATAHSAGRWQLDRRLWERWATALRVYRARNPRRSLRLTERRSLSVALARPSCNTPGQAPSLPRPVSGNRFGGYSQACKGRFETACASLWHGEGIPAREIGDRVGQRQISTTLDVYTHVPNFAG